MKRTLSSEAQQLTGKTINVRGWVNARRDHGGLIFLDVRDHKGIIQAVIKPENKDSFLLAEKLRDEYVVSIHGTVIERDPQLKNPNIATGSIEIETEGIELLNKSEPLPIQVSGDTVANEDLRLRYRYLDLRRKKLSETLKKRAAFYKYMRNYMDSQDFIEISTPILANSSPEGARDFLVPSRLHPGKFYALPQAPQQFKQLLMVGGIARYYQLATCFRDEDPRADRLYGDFYQLDMEMAFVQDGEEIRQMMEPLMKQLVVDFAGKQLLTDDIPRISYQDAVEQYGSDKPDLRFGMKLIDLSEELASSEFSVFSQAVKQGGAVKAICVKNAAEMSRSQIDTFTNIAKNEGAKGLAYIIFKDNAVKSPIAKFMNQDELGAVKQKTKADNGDIVFFAADERSTCNKVLGRLRNEFADFQNLRDPNVISLAWVVDFPFYEWDAKNKKIDFGHNPFSMPKGGIDALKTEDKLSVVADQYDMVMNGYEICSGAVRNHNPEIMYGVFKTVGYDKSYVDAKFGAMINAFKFGAPPHAGSAFGIDRILMILIGEDNVREVVAFPKNGSGVDVMMNSPIDLEQSQLDELSIIVNTDEED